MFMIDLGAPSHYSVLGVAPDSDVKEIRAALIKIRGDLNRRQARNPDERRSLEDRQARINSIGGELSDPVKRAHYDTQNAHLTFFVVRRAAAAILEERDLRLRWVHRAVRDFLLEKGERVAPADDLERSDFTADFSPNPVLDDILLSWRSR